MGELRSRFIKHDGGQVEVQTEINDDDTITIYFGASYTLRVDETNLYILRELLFESEQEMMMLRTADFGSDSKEITAALRDEDDDIEDGSDYAAPV
jgi:hypothetical protein